MAPATPSTLEGALADLDHPALIYVDASFSGVGFDTPALSPARCPFDAASQYFVCTPLTAGNLTLNQRFTLTDASGARQSAFSEKTTANLHVENSVSGSFAENATTTTVDGQQTLDLTGLGTPRHTLNGTSLTLASVVDPTRGAASPTQTEHKTTITDLVFPVVVASAPLAWPLSGTVDFRSRSVDALGNAYVSIATMRFSGSSIVTLTMTVPGGIQTCQANLATTGAGCETAAGGPAVSKAVPDVQPALRF